MNKNSLDKWNKIINNGKKKFILKYGVLGWGFTTGIVYTIINYFTEQPIIIKEFIFISSITLIIFPLLGILWGSFMFNYMRKKCNKVNQK